MSGRLAVRGLLAIAGREVSERAALLGLAVFVAAAPFVAPHLGVGDRPMLGLLMGTMIVGAAAVLTGSSVIARDLAEGRLGFLLARPVPWWSIWGGKLLAALVLTFAAGAIVLVPSALTGDWRLPPAGWWALIGIPGMLALISAVHALTVGYRSRSGWFALDLALLWLLGWIVTRTFLSLVQSGVDAGHVDLVSAGLWTLALALVAGSAAQVARGRVDIRRGHRVLAIVVWSVLVPVVLLYAAWAAWLSRPTPASLRTVVSAEAAPGGPWLAVIGRPRWPRPASMFSMLVVDPASGRFVRMSPSWTIRGPAFSADGARVAWADCPPNEEPRLFVADLRSPHPSAQRGPLPVPSEPIRGLALSEDGVVAAVVQASGITVFKVGSQRPSAMAPVHVEAFTRRIAFDRRGTVHVLAGPQEWLGSGVLALVELEPSTGRYRVTGTIPTRGNAVDLWAPDAARVALIDRQDRRPSLGLYDGATGALLATPVAEGTAADVAATFLHDGRLAFVEAGRGVRLHVVDRDGREVLALDVAPAFAHARVTAVRPGIVAVHLPFQAGGRRSKLVLVDVDAGRVTRVEDGLRPAASGWFGAKTGLGSDLFIEERNDAAPPFDGGTLVRLDPISGARVRLLPAI